MSYWLMKSEPDAWSWDQQVKKGVESWNGVRNHQAAANLKAMKKGDLAFFYHSNIGKEIVGIVEIVREAYPDPTDEKGKFVMVDVKTLKALKKPVPLSSIKVDEKLKSMMLLRQSRLSVQPVTQKEWNHICFLGEI